MTQRTKRLIANIAGLSAVFLMMAAAAIVQSDRFFGKDAADLTHRKDSTTGPQVVKVLDDNRTLVNTTALCPDISGYGGPVPVEITFKADTITSIVPLRNYETDAFFNRVIDSGLVGKFNGLTAAEAAELHVDAVSGATYSSTALITNIERGIAEYARVNGEHTPASTFGGAGEPGWKFYCSLAVIIMGMVLPLFIRNKKYRIIQQLLNAGVLGFWCGVFIDYTMMLGVLSGGFTAGVAMLIPILLLVTAFIYPLFGHDGHYCAWVCPFGSLQELASDCNPTHRLHISPSVVKVLTNLRMILWGVLMVLLWGGLWVSWIDYELFMAFIVRNAPVGIIIAGGVFILLSVWIPRPYCRFICPTGTLLRISQNLESK